LRSSVPDYDPARGIEVEVPDGARVADLLAHLGPAGPKAAVVSVNHVIAGPDRVIEAGAEVTVMQAMYGG